MVVKLTGEKSGKRGKQIGKMSLNTRSTNSNIVMDPFEQGYYSVNKIFLSIIGQWPYQRRSSRRMMLAVIAALATSLLIPQMAALFTSDDPDILIKSVTPLFVQFDCLVKVVNLENNTDQILKLIEWIKKEWILLAHQATEIHIFENYAGTVKRFAISYAVLLWISISYFVSTPIVHKIKIFLRITNESQPVRYLGLLEYFWFDVGEYYLYLFIHVYTCGIAACVILVAADTLFFTFIQHACAMFAVLDHQLQQITDEPAGGSNLYHSPNNDASLNSLILCIKKHQEVIEFAELVESMYTWNLFSITGLNMLALSVVALQTMLSLNDNLEDILSNIFVAIGVTIHLFVQCFLAQKLMDHSERIRDCLFHAKWYNTSRTTQKLVHFMIMRTHVPCQVTAGKFFVISHENFASILKTSVSYFTVMHSMRH